MEVCPYCQKPFKRLKSHLPHCKKIEPAGGEDQKALPSKPAPLTSTKKTRRLTQGVTEPGTGIGGKPKVTRDTREGLIQPFPVRDAGVGGAGTPGAGGDFWSQIQVSLRAQGVAEPKAALQGGSAPKAKPTKAPKPQRQGREPAKTEAALPRDPSLSVPEKTSSSALAEKIRAVSARVGVDEREPHAQKLRGKASGIPRGGSHHSPTSLGHGGPSFTDLSSNARASDGRSHVPLSAAGPEARAQAPRPPSLLLHMSPRHEKQGQDTSGPGLSLGGRAQGDTGKAGESVAVAGTVVRASTSRHPKKDLLVSLAPRLRTGSQAPNPSLVALAVKCLPAEKAEARPPQGVPKLQVSPLSQQFVSGEPTLGAWPQAKVLPGRLLAQQTSPATRGLPAAMDAKPPAGSLGLQWLPELYPAYLGLSVFPGKLQYWDIVAPKLQLATPQGESHTQVPLWGRSWTRLRSLEPTSLAPSNLSLESLLAAVQRGWLKCGACMRSGVGNVTMLFTGYFVLCCNWSFKHLKLQRWRK